MFKDSYNRIHDYLRISLTDHCNLRCFYCMPDEDYDFAHASSLMRADEIEKLARLFVSQGVKKIRLTGGEPLVRKDAGEILQALARLPVELTMTSNGTRIHLFIQAILEAGMQSVNISLDTLQESTFRFITRRNDFQKVRENIDLLISHQIRVKVNVVVMKGINEREILDFIDWTQNTPIEIRFIEFMPFTGNSWTSNQVVSLEEILNIVQQQFVFDSVPGSTNDTAKHFRIPGHQGSFAVISTMTAPFCSSCNRMRLTADGKFKNCLFSEMESDLLTPLRNGKDVLPIILESLQAKKEKLGGQFSGTLATLDATAIHNRTMISIGG